MWPSEDIKKERHVVAPVRPCKSRQHATPLRRGDSRFAATKSR